LHWTVEDEGWRTWDELDEERKEQMKKRQIKPEKGVLHVPEKYVKHLGHLYKHIAEAEYQKVIGENRFIGGGHKNYYGKQSNKTITLCRRIFYTQKTK
jgi:hypothetical protein